MKSIKVPVYLTIQQIKELDFVREFFGGESRSSVLRRGLMRLLQDMRLKLKIDENTEQWH